MEPRQKKVLIVYGYIRSDIGVREPPSDIAIEMMEWIYLRDSWDVYMTNPCVSIIDNGYHIISKNKTFSDWFHSFGSLIISAGNKWHWTLKISDYFTSERIIGIIDNQYISKNS